MKITLHDKVHSELGTTVDFEITVMTTNEHSENVTVFDKWNGTTSIRNLSLIGVHKHRKHSAGIDGKDITAVRDRLLKVADINGLVIFKPYEGPKLITDFGKDWNIVFKAKLNLNNPEELKLYTAMKEESVEFDFITYFETVTYLNEISYKRHIAMESITYKYK